MNERLEAFRKRLRSNKVRNERMKPREWLAIVISVTALGLSATSTYFSTIVQREKLEGLILESVAMKFDGKIFQPRGPVRVLFVNRGNMPLAVTGGSLSFKLALKNDETGGCRYVEDVGEDRSFEVEPFVIKPAEIVIKSLSFDEQPFGLKDLVFGEYYFVNSCISVEAVTTNGRTFDSQFIGWWSYPTKEDKTDGMQRDKFEYSVGGSERWPFSIVDRQGSIFFPLQ